VGYALFPHIGCIAFIIASVIGSTVLMQLFKPLLMNRNFFYILIGISFAFATISSVLYLKRNRMLSGKGIRRNSGYLAIMYGTTIGINILLFLVIFPLLANVKTSGLNQGANSLAGSSPGFQNFDSTAKLSVDIPCSGHAPLISSELKKIDGVGDIKFSYPNIFEVKYDSERTNPQEITSIDVFREYPAKIMQ
ncbi:MAG: hypothetical protein NTV63_00530, partial [Candidatus Woesearchaeota archaeon]|nr:hypothetical protein [Candidatus Woesearchaeota archaeon]